MCLCLCHCVCACMPVYSLLVSTVTRGLLVVMHMARSQQCRLCVVVVQLIMIALWSLTRCLFAYFRECIKIIVGNQEMDPLGPLMAAAPVKESIMQDGCQV